MEITADEKQGITIIKLQGRMDATTVASFEDVCRTKLEEGFLKIAVDLSELEYISSAGLRGILIMEKLSRTKGGKIGFCSLKEMVEEVFKISGFNSILLIGNNIDEIMSTLA